MQMAMEVRLLLTRWPSTPRRLLPAIRPRLWAVTVAERFAARCAGALVLCVPIDERQLTFSRRHLAVREHMMDHILDQAPVSRPRTPSNFALPSPRLSVSAGSDTTATRARRGSAVSDVINPLTGQPVAKSRQGSFSNTPAVSPLSPLTTTDSNFSFQPVSPGAGVPMPKPNSHTITVNGSLETTSSLNGPMPFPQVAATPNEMSRTSSADQTRSARGPQEPAPRHFQSADQLSSRLPPQLLALRQAGSGANLASPVGSSPASSPDRENSSQPFPNSQGVQNAARRMSMLAMTPSEGTSRERKGSNASDIAGYGGAVPNAGPPILVNPKCSGYFVEPVSRFACGRCRDGAHIGSSRGWSPCSRTVTSRGRSCARTKNAMPRSATLTGLECSADARNGSLL